MARKARVPEPGSSVYQGRAFAFLTQHGKERVVGPVFAAGLQARVELCSGFDTDGLGTFTREIPRPGSQLEAAREKAWMGLELSGLPLALASEGTFGPGPMGLGSWDSEFLLLVDQERGIEILGRSFAAARQVHGAVDSLESLERIATRAGFPDHGLVLRPDDEDALPITKGLRDWDALRAGFRRLLAESETGAVHVENDLRAMHHPGRMANIRRAAEDLVMRMQQCCAECGSPGFGVEGKVPGLPCLACQRPTAVAKAENVACVACGYAEVRPLPDAVGADPGMCDTCNP